MTKSEMRRKIITEKVADHLLAQGMKMSSLRQLAAAAEISDRMLLHYFVNKEEVLTAALTQVMHRQVQLLSQAYPEPMSVQVLLAHLAGMIQEPHIRPYLRLWLELAALTAAEETAYTAIAQQLGAAFLEWITSAVAVEQAEQRQPMAALALATLEGFILLDVLGYDQLITDALQGMALCAKCH